MCFYLFIYLFIYLFVYLFIYLFTYLFIYLSIYLFNYLFFINSMTRLISIMLAFTSFRRSVRLSVHRPSKKYSFEVDHSVCISQRPLLKTTRLYDKEPYPHCVFSKNVNIFIYVCIFFTSVLEHLYMSLDAFLRVRRFKVQISHAPARL